MRSNAESKKTTAAFSPLLLPLLSFFFFFFDHNPRTGSGVAAEPRTRRLPAARHPRGAVVRRPTPWRQSAWLRCKIWKCHTKERLQLHYILLYHIVVQSVLSLIYFIFWWTLSNEGRIYQVLKAQHTQHGRGGATIQVELRDVDTGNKITERFRTDEAIERVFVEEKSFTFLYHEGDSVMLMDPNTFEQVEVPKELFGKAAGYLKEDMTVSVQYYDEKPMSASVPIRVTCTVVDAQPPSKGLTAAPQYKKVLLDNGLTVLAPPFIVTGDEIVINTMDDSYITRAKE